MPRKSLFIKEENDKTIQIIRSRFLNQEKPIDVDYTTMVNILIETGDFILTNRRIDIKDMTNIMTKYADIEKETLKKLLTKN